MKSTFKARDYVFRKPTMAQAFVDSFPNIKLTVPHVREPKLAKDGIVIKADFKRGKGNGNQDAHSQSQRLLVPEAS